MTRVDESFEDELRRLTSETEAVAPRADFAARVMERLAVSHPDASTQSDWSIQVLRWSKIGMAMATMAAAACLAVAWDTANAAELEEAMNYGVLEAFE